MSNNILFIVHLDRVVCYLHTGISNDVVKRAAEVLDATGKGNHVERLSDENIVSQDQQYQVFSIISLIS